jgi:antitoxin HicB
MKKKNSFTVSNGDLVLQLESAEEGGYIVTSSLEPELITEAETLEDAFVMARDAIKALRTSRAKLHRKLALSKGAS